MKHDRIITLNKTTVRANSSEYQYCLIDHKNVSIRQQ